MRCSTNTGIRVGTVVRLGGSDKSLLRLSVCHSRSDRTETLHCAKVLGETSAAALEVRRTRYTERRQDVLPRGLGLERLPNFLSTDADHWHR